MKIAYTGIKLYDTQYLSTYYVGEMTYLQRREMQDIHSQTYFCDEDSARYHYNIVRSYLKHHNKLLYDWLKECKIPFGAHIESSYGITEAYILLKPKSQEELSFRLCFDIKVTIE